ncbi:MFS transporter, partial [Nonomuraea antimicrobica]|uniref:MFS transporter n=1 Tax=Nonomuraea antimicrobica TaxID=561173 RepID=UPI0031EABA89
MSASLPPEAVLRRFSLLSFFANLPAGLHMAPIVLLLSARGLDPAAIGLVFAAYGVTTVVLELPTGGLADVIGRRVILMMSAVLGTAGLALMGVGTSLPELMLASVLRGVSRTLRTGPLESWYVDSLRATDPEADLKAGLARGGAWGSAALAAGALAGGLVALVLPAFRWGPVIPLSVPLLLAAAASAVLFLLVLGVMPEPPYARVGLRAILRNVPATILLGARVSGRDVIVLRVLAVALGTGLALNAVELLTPGRIAQAVEHLELAGGAYAIVVTLGFAATAAGSALARALARLP